jgi:monoamine oxidase
VARSIDRRRFLETLAAVTAGPLAIRSRIGPAGTDATSTRVAANTDRAQRVVVLGAGLAGLAAAYRLMKRGYDVTVVEAQNRPGGRVLTVRDGFHHGGFAEMGAVRIFDTHAHTLKYVTEFGLELVPYTDTGTHAFYMRGKRFRAPAAGERWPLDGFAPHEQPDPSSLFPRYVLPAVDKIGKISGPHWPAAFPTALALDRLTIDDYLASQGASATWRRWFAAHEGNFGRANALAAFTMESITGGKTVMSIKGGNDTLPKALATALGPRVRYASPVVRLAQRADGIVVGVADRTGLDEIVADRCVCALPFATLRNVVIATPFSDQKMSAIHRLKYMAAARYACQTSSQFWKQDSLGALGGLNMIGTDTMAGRIWNTSALQPNRSTGMLLSYMVDAEALRFTSFGADERVDVMTGLMRQILPGLDAQTIGIAHKAWHEDPWQGGAWGWTQPGELQVMFHAIRRVEGRVHFAGEHTSHAIAWMNGALESAERVVDEVLAADGRSRGPA